MLSTIIRLYLLVLLEEVRERPGDDSSVCVTFCSPSDCECLARASLMGEEIEVD